LWSAYGSVWVRGRQDDLIHLLRKLDKVEEANAAADWRQYAEHLRRPLRDRMRLRTGHFNR